MTSPENLDRYARALESCVCYRIRRASRSLTQMFDEWLQPSGLRSTQMPILVGIGTNGPQSLSTLAHSLLMDRSTLSRNLRPLLDAEFVELQRGADRRQKVAALTERGRTALTRALPLWEHAQQHIVAHLGATRCSELRDALGYLEAATTAVPLVATSAVGAAASA